MSSDWPRVPLGTLFKTSSGATPLKSRKDFYQDGNVPWLLSGEVSQGYIDTASKFITEKALKETTAKLFPVDSVLVAMYGATAGQVGLLKFESATNQAVCAIYPSPEYLPKFVFYALLSMKQVLVSQAAGNAQPNVSQAKIKELPFPVVSLDEQKRIVAKLDEGLQGIDQMILNFSKSINELESFKKSAVSEVIERQIDDVGSVRIDQVFTIARGGSPRPIKKFLTDSPDGVNWIKISDATRTGKYITDTVEKITRDGISRSRFVKAGDLLLSNSMSFGRPYILKTDGCIHDGWLVLSAKQADVDTEFMYYLLGSQFVYRQFDALAAGSTVRNLNKDLVASVQIPMPAIQAQRTLMQRFQEIEVAAESLLKNISKQLEFAETFRKSVLSTAFTGDF